MILKIWIYHMNAGECDMDCPASNHKILEKITGNFYMVKVAYSRVYKCSKVNSNICFFSLSFSLFFDSIHAHIPIFLKIIHHLYLHKSLDLTSHGNFTSASIWAHSHTLSGVEVGATYKIIGRTRVYAWLNMQYYHVLLLDQH